MLETQAIDVRWFGLAAHGVEHFIWESARGWRVNVVCFFVVFCALFFCAHLLFHLVYLPEPI